MVRNAEWTVGRAALALSGGDRARAAALLAPVLAGDLAVGASSQIAAWLLAARVHLGSGARPAAREALRRALALAKPELRRRPFLRPGPVGRNLLAAFPDLVAAHGWLGLTPDQGPDGAGSDERLVGGPPVERLTERETTVLVRMAQAMSAEDIANDLFLSVNTVKTHQRSIYRKLAVSRRNDAVRRARDLGLV